MVEEASRLGLDGWVRNRRDGSVEAVVAGPGAAVEAVLLACWQGPSAARVRAVDAMPADDAVVAGFRRVATV